jgi:hypothetical protein
MKLDLLTNAAVVDNAIRFVSGRSKDKEKMESSDSNDKEESDEPDYDEDEEYNTIVVNLLCWWYYFSN